MVVVRSQVDFDDEGWLGGFVDSLREDEEGGVVYTVRLDDGEMADDVEGSEIRPAELRPARGGRGGGGADDGTLAAGGEHPASSGEQSVSSGSRCANTREDALSAFDLDLSMEARSVGSESSFDESALTTTAQMQCRVSDSGVEWSFINEEQLVWSPPTTALLKAHDDRFPRWMEVKNVAL